MASVFKRGRWVDAQGRKCRKDIPRAKWVESRFYTVQYRLPGGRIKRVKGYADKGASEQLGAKLEKAKARGGQDMVDVFAPHRKRAISQHVDDYLFELRSSGRDRMYVYNCEKRLRKLIADCKWEILADISADSFCRWREAPITEKTADSEDRKIGPSTLNQYLETIRAFCRWCVKRKRMPTNPMDDVAKVEESVDARRARRALNDEELAALLVFASDERANVYRFAFTTGLRRQELTDLQWGDIHLGISPYITLRAAATKSRRADMLPLRADVAARLRLDRPDDAAGTDRVFRRIPTMDELRDDLETARTKWIEEADTAREREKREKSSFLRFKDELGRRIDFHALRTTLGSMLNRAGVPLRTAMSLLRHTDPKLTLGICNGAISASMRSRLGYNCGLRRLRPIGRVRFHSAPMLPLISARINP